MKKPIIALLMFAIFIMLASCTNSTDITVTVHSDSKQDQTDTVTTDVLVQTDARAEDQPVALGEKKGFALDKFRFESIDGYKNIYEDQEIVDGINEIIRVWKYTYDTIEFMFWCKGEIEESAFEGMNCESIIGQTKYSPWVVVEVAFENVNLEALKYLSHRSEITAIIISVPLIPEPSS